MTIRRTMLFATALAIFLTCANAAQAQEAAGTVKVAIASPARIFNEMQETKDLKAKMETERKTLEGTEKEKRDKLNALKADRDALKPDSPQYHERNKELVQAAIEFEVWGKMMQAEVQRNQKQQMKHLYDLIEVAVGEVAKQKGIDLVIADQRADMPENLESVNVDQLRAIINQRDVLYSVPKVDITNDVIASLDAAYKGK